MRKFNFKTNLELRISVWRTWSTSCNLDNIKAIQGAQIVYIYNYWEIFTFSDFCYFFEHPRCSNCQHILIQFVTLLKCSSFWLSLHAKKHLFQIFTKFIWAGHKHSSQVLLTTMKDELYCTPSSRFVNIDYETPMEHKVG